MRSGRYFRTPTRQLSRRLISPTLPLPADHVLLPRRGVCALRLASSPPYLPLLAGELHTYMTCLVCSQVRRCRDSNIQCGCARARVCVCLRARACSQDPRVRTFNSQVRGCVSTRYTQQVPRSHLVFPGARACVNTCYLQQAARLTPVFTGEWARVCLLIAGYRVRMALISA